MDRVVGSRHWGFSSSYKVLKVLNVLKGIKKLTRGVG